MVLIFSQDRAQWLPPSRRVRAARPATDGSFEVPDLPPGDYLIAAVTRARPDEWEHPAFLARLVANAGRVTIAEGEQHVQDVRVASRR